MVDGPDNRVTERPYDGVVVIPLLNGGEEDVGHHKRNTVPVEGVTRFTLTCPTREVPFLLDQAHSHVGTCVQILRGDKLEGRLAPKAGVRYDGL